jgi:hypothetical protein
MSTKAQKARAISASAKKVGRFLNNNTMARDALALIPYAPQAIVAANYGVQALDTFADLMQSFGQGVSHPQLANGQVAGVANEVVVRRSAPKYSKSKAASRGAITITHKELVGAVYNASGTNVITSPTRANGSSVYQVNATSALFPWLSTIAANYDMFRFKRVRLVYVPTCSTATAGRVMLGYDVDSTDPLPFDRYALSNYRNSVELSSWGMECMDIDLPKNMSWYYCDATAPSNSPDSLNALLSQGQAFWATWAGADNNAIGEMYVLYEVELKDPQPSTVNVARAAGTGGSVTTQFAYSAPVVVGSSATVITLSFMEPGVYQIHVKAACTAAGAPTFNAGVASLSSLLTQDAAFTLIAFNAIVNVTSSGYSTSPGADTIGYIQLPGLTALGAYTVFVNDASIANSAY